MKRLYGLLACVRGEALLLSRRLVRVLLPLLLLAFCVLLALGTVTRGAEAKDAPLRLALADKENSFLSRTAVGMIAANDEIAALFTVENCDEESALDGMKSGRYAAAILFEEDFISKIIAGDETAVRIILSDALRQNGSIVQNAAETGEILMKTAEYAVNVAWKPLRDALPYDEAARAMAKLELSCGLEFLSLPTDAFSSETLPYSENGTALVPHYFLCFAVFLLFLAETIFASGVRQSCSYAFLCRLRALGIGDGGLLLGKSVFPLLLRALLLLGLCLAGQNAVGVTANAGAVGCALLALLFVSLFSTALSILFSDSPLGAAIPGALAAVGLFLCGGLLPLHLLPQSVVRLGALTPFGAAADLLAPFFGGVCAPRAYLLAALYAALAVCLALKHLRKIRRNGGLTV